MLRDFLLSLRAQFHSTAAVALRVLSPFKVPRPRNIRQVATEFGANSRTVSATPTIFTTPAVAIRIPTEFISEDVSQARTKVRTKLSATHSIRKGWHATSHSTCSTHQIFHHGYAVCLLQGVMHLISSCRNAFELRDCDTSDLVRCGRKVPRYP